MQLRYELFSDEDVLKPGFGEGFSLVLFGAGHVSESQTALGGSVGRQRIRDLIHDGVDYRRQGTRYSWTLGGVVQAQKALSLTPSWPTGPLTMGHC